MDLTLTLLMLRVASAALLLVFLGALFLVIWHDYRSAMKQIKASRRSYGYLVEMHEIDQNYVASGDVHALLPLTSIGRAPTNTIQINQNYASSEHAIIARRNGQWWLEDRRSRNGTTLNGLPVTRPTVITNNDLVGIGQIVYRVELEE